MCIDISLVKEIKDRKKEMQIRVKGDRPNIFVSNPFLPDFTAPETKLHHFQEILRSAEWSQVGCRLVVGSTELMMFRFIFRDIDSFDHCPVVMNKFKAGRFWLFEQCPVLLRFKNTSVNLHSKPTALMLHFRSIPKIFSNSQAPTLC